MSTFSKEELKRYNRQMILPEVGLKGQEKLKVSKVLVIGAGGLGSPVLYYLAAAGVGTIGIVEFDTIESSNLHRQILYDESDTGKSKCMVAAEKICRQNPHINAVAHHAMLNEKNAREIIDSYEIIIDGSDNFMTRYLINDTCVALKKTLIYGSILGDQGQLAVFNHNGSKNLRDLFPEPPNPDEVPSCSENGVLGTVPGILGTMMANYCIHLILQKPIEINQLFIINTADYSIQRLAF